MQAPQDTRSWGAWWWCKSGNSLETTSNDANRTVSMNISHPVYDYCLLYASFSLIHSINKGLKVPSSLLSHKFTLWAFVSWWSASAIKSATKTISQKKKTPIITITLNWFRKRSKHDDSEYMLKMPFFYCLHRSVCHFMVNGCRINK